MNERLRRVLAVTLVVLMVSGLALIASAQWWNGEILPGAQGVIQMAGVVVWAAAAALIVIAERIDNKLRGEKEVSHG